MRLVAPHENKRSFWQRGTGAYPDFTVLHNSLSNHMTFITRGMRCIVGRV